MEENSDTLEEVPDPEARMGFNNYMMANQGQFGQLGHTNFMLGNKGQLAGQSNQLSLLNQYQNQYGQLGGQSNQYGQLGGQSNQFGQLGGQYGQASNKVNTKLR